MTSIYIIQGDSLESFYEQTIHYLEAKYHSYPPYSPNTHIDSRTASEMSTHERMAADLQDICAQDIPLGKIVL